MTGNRIWPVLLAAWLLGMTAAPLPAAEWAQTTKSLENRAVEIAQGAERLRADAKQEKAALAAELEVLRETAARKEAELTAVRQAFEDLEAKEAEAQEALSGEKRRSGDIQAASAMAARDLEALWRAAPLMAVDPQKMAPVRRIQDQPGETGMAELRALVDLAFDDMAASGRIGRTEVDFVDRTGAEQRAEAALLGGLNVYYRSGAEAGMLIPTADGGLVEPEGRIGRADRKAIARFFDREGVRLPVDISGGAALERLEPRRSFRDWVRSGGLLLWPLLAIAGIALILFLERTAALLRIQGNTDAVMEQLRDRAANDDWEEARRLCDRHPRAPACRVLAVGLDHRDRPDETLENLLREAILKEQPALERFLPTLSVLAAIAPLLGLLGTVTGMIETFQVITRFGAGDPRLMAGGISEALITTQVGLSVALPILLGHHFLDRRADRIMTDMEEKALAFLGAFRPGPGRTAD